MDAMPIQNLQDSNAFSETRTSNTVSGDLDGGFRLTRPRTTRPPLLKFSTGFTEIDDAEKDLLFDFFGAVGEHTAFYYDHPVSNVTYVVRLESQPQFKYVGMGGNGIWTVSNIELMQV